MIEQLDLLSIGIGAVLSGIVAYAISRHFSEKKRLSYFSAGRSIFSIDKLDEADQFEIFFKGEEVGYVNSHRLLIWNSGNRALWEENFGTESRLRFAFEEGASIKIDAIEFCSEGVQWDPQVHKNEFVPNFRVLDSGQGVSVSILETKEKSQLTMRKGDGTISPVEVLGQVVDLEHPPKREPVPDPMDQAPSLLLGVLVLVISLTIIVVSALVDGMNRLGSELQNLSSDRLLLLGVLLIGIVVQLWLFVRNKLSYVPAEFRELESERRMRDDPISSVTSEVAESFGKEHK